MRHNERTNPLNPNAEPSDRVAVKNVCQVQDARASSKLRHQRTHDARRWLALLVAAAVVLGFSVIGWQINELNNQMRAVSAKPRLRASDVAGNQHENQEIFDQRNKTTGKSNDDPPPVKVVNSSETDSRLKELAWRVAFLEQLKRDRFKTMNSSETDSRLKELALRVAFLEQLKRGHSKTIPNGNRSCAFKKDGIYAMDFSDGNPPTQVQCKNQWIVMQKRTSGLVDFFRQHWIDYKRGFGNVYNYWLGNDNIHKLGSCVLRVELEDSNGATAHAQYDTFSVGDENSAYQLSVSGYSGDAGDSLSTHNGFKFSTNDRDNDASSSTNCAAKFKGAWWYSSCHSSNLNAQYLPPGPHESYADGINWASWRGYHSSMKSTYMLLRCDTLHI